MKRLLFVLIFNVLFIPSVFALDMPFSNYIVRDMDSGRIFYQKAINERRLPASTTKIMTAIVGIENSNLFDVVTVGDEILTMDGTNVYLEVGEKILMQDLLYGLILRSGNDASMSIARHAGGSVNNFVKLMNDKAHSLGLKNTIFNNPSGLDDYEKNYSTVNDLSMIYKYAYQNDTFRNIVGAKSYKTSSNKKSYLFHNKTKIVSMYEKATGGKTGYTPDAGRLLVSSAADDDLNIVIATIGNDYGYNNHINMYENIFSNYKKYIILDKDKFKVKSELNGSLYIKNSFSYPLSENEIDKVSKKIVFNNKKKGMVGEVFVYLDDEVIHREDVYLKNKKNKISFFDKIFQIFK